MVIPQDYLIVLTLIASYLSHRLRGAGLSQDTNALLAGSALLICGIVTAFISTGFTTDIKADALLVCTAIASLLATGKEYVALANYLEDAPSPLAPAPSPYPPTALRKSAGMPFNLPPEE